MYCKPPYKQLSYFSKTFTGFWFIVSCLLTGFYSCKPIALYEQTKHFPSQQWEANEKPSFVFEIKDTTAFYNVYIVLRHTQAYHFNNIWLNVSIQSPSGKSQTFRTNLKLANNTQWLGSEMGEVVEHHIALFPQPITLQKGNYQFVLQHIMRENPLQGILQAGIRIEKAF